MKAKCVELNGEIWVNLDDLRVLLRQIGEGRHSEITDELKALMVIGHERKDTVERILAIVIGNFLCRACGIHRD